MLIRPFALLLAVLLLLPISVGSAAPRPRQTAPVASVYRLTTDLGIPASPAVNVADRISAAVDALPPGATLIFEGMYRVDWGVRVGGKSGVTLARADGVTEAGLVRFTQPEKPDGWGFDQPWYPYFQIVGSDNIQILNLTIRGPNKERHFSGPHFESAHGFSVLASQRIRIAGARVFGVHGDVMRVAHGPCRISRCLTPTSDITFEDGYGYMPGRHAFGMVGGTRITVRRTKVEMASRSGVDFEPLPREDPGQVTDVLFEDVTLWDFVNYGVALHNNTAYRYVFRRVNMRGGLGSTHLISDLRTPRIYPPHEDIVFEDFTYTNKTPNPRRDGNYWEGGFRAESVINLLVVRANMEFGNKKFAVFNAQGYVQGSTFRNDAGTPAACLGPQMTEAGNVGTFRPCPAQ
jgi:hypothetical protein